MSSSVVYINSASNYPLFGSYSHYKHSFPQFAAFIQKHCPNYTEAAAMQLVNEGYLLACQISAGVAEDSIPPRERSKKLAGFNWYLMYLSVGIGQEFHEGMIVFKDPEHKINNFFKKSTNTYRRWSSHFNGRVPTNHALLRFNTNAIDVSQNFNTGFPANKKTCIFSEVQMIDGDDWTMMKIEDHPAALRCPISLVHHTWGWVRRSIIARTMPSQFGYHDKPGYRDEIAPPGTLKRFRSLVNELMVVKAKYYFFSSYTKEDQELVKAKNEILSRVNKFGISAIYKAFSEYAKWLDPFHAKVIGFKFEMLREFPHVEATGKEVVLKTLI